MAVDRRGNIVGILKIVRLKVRPAMHRIHVRSSTGKATFPMDTDGMFTYVEHTMSTALDHLTKLADDARASRASRALTRRCSASDASTYCLLYKYASYRQPNYRRSKGVPDVLVTTKSMEMWVFLTVSCSKLDQII